MDTRTKILEPEAAAEAARRLRSAGTPVKLVTGHFDPLLAAHARRLAEIAAQGGALVVAITDPLNPLLPARARAELVAGLSVVDYVVLAGTAMLGGLFDLLPADAVVREEAADEVRAQDLRNHVRSRHKSA